MDTPSIIDPIDALANHFRSSGLGPAGNHASLRIPPSLKESLDTRLGLLKDLDRETKARYDPTQIKYLVSSISEEDFERWCYLDTATFILVTRVLLETEPCLARDQGIFRLIVSSLLLEALETLGDENSKLAMSKEVLVDYKDTIGESLAVRLLDYFIDARESGFSRRWGGLLLVELLEESGANRERVWKLPDKFFKDIGEIIVSGDDRMLKIVAGKIIWQMVRDFESEEDIQYQLAKFFQSSEADNFAKDFPLQSGSQWESGFASFITEMELNRYDLDYGSPTGYAGLQVKLGNNSPISPDMGAISISIAEIFSIYIPPNKDRSPDWVDFKIANISRIELTKQVVTEDSMNDLTYFKLHLCDYNEDGYLYLLSMRPSSDSDNVTILCYKDELEDFAEDVERCRDTVLQRNGSRWPMTSAPMKDIQANPAYYRSQQEKLNELERHRKDIMKVLESPKINDGYASSVTDPDEGLENAISGKGSPELAPNTRKVQAPISTNSSQNPTEINKLAPDLSLHVPLAVNDRLRDISEISIRKSSPSFRPPQKSRQLPQVEELPNAVAGHDPEPSGVTIISGEEDLEEVFRILKRKTTRKAKENQGGPRPVVPYVTGILDAPSKDLLATGYLDIPVIGNSQANLAEDLWPSVPGELLSQGLIVKGVPLSIELKPKEITISNVAEVQDELHTPQSSYGAKNRAKDKEKPKEGIPSKNNPSNKIKKAQTVATKSTVVSKSRTRATKSGKKKLISPEDTSIWDLPESGESGIEGKISTRKGKGRLKAPPQKEMPAQKVKLPAKRKLQPKKPVNGKKSVTKPEPKSNELILDSDEEIGSVQGLKMPTNPPMPKQKNLRPNHQAVPKISKSTAIQDSEDEEVEQENKLSIYSLRSRMKPKPKQKAAPASVLLKHTLVDNEDEEMKSLEEEEESPIRAPTPLPKLRQEQKRVPQSVSFKHMAAENSENEVLKLVEDERLPPQRSMTTLKIVPALASAKRIADEDDWPELQTSPTCSPKAKAVLKTAPASILTKRVASRGSGNEDINPPNKRKRPEQPKTARARETSPSQPARKAPANQGKRPRPYPFLNTSEADDDSSWRPKTRLRAKMELAAKSTERKRNSIELEKQNPKETAEATLERESTEKKTGKAKNVSYHSGGKHKMAQRSPSPGTEASEILADPMGSIHKSKTEIQENQKLAKPDGEVFRTLSQTSVISHDRPIRSETPERNSTHLGNVHIDLIPSENLSSDSEEIKARTSSRVGSVLQSVDPTRTRKRVILHDIKESVKDQNILETEKYLEGGDYIVGESNSRYSGQTIPRTIDHRELAKENAAPTALMNLEVPSSHRISESLKNPPSDHSQDLTPLQEQGRSVLPPLDTSRQKIKALETPQAPGPSEVLIDDHLARKVQIISWSSEGPKNQGRTTAIDNFHVDNSLVQDGLSTSDDDNNHDTPSPITERALSLFFFASDEEDRVATREKKPGPFIVRPMRRETETVVDKNGSPLLAPVHRLSNSIEPVEIGGSDRYHEERVSEDEHTDDLVMIDVVDKQNYLQQRTSISQEDSVIGPITTRPPKEPQRTSYLGLQDTSDAETDLEMRDTSNDDDQKYSTTNNLEDFERISEVEEFITTSKGLEAHQERTSRKISIIEISDSDDPDDPDDEQPKLFSQQDSFKLSTVHPQKSDGSLTLRKLPIAQQVTKPFPETKVGLPQFSESTLLNIRRPIASKNILSELEEMPQVVNGALSGVSMGEKHPKTSFSKWLQESGLKANKNSCDNRAQGPSKSLNSGDPDKTLVNESNYDDSGMGRDFTGNPQERNQRQERQSPERDMLGGDSDDSDSDSDTDDSEDSDTDEEYEDEEPEDEDVTNMGWQQSLPNYHRETLAVLGQISRGLLRYLMSGEEIAMEVIKEFEKQGNEIVKRLGDSHKNEYDEFLTRLKLASEKVKAEHTKAAKVIEEDLAKMRKEGEVLVAIRARMGEHYNALDDKISTLIASLEEDLEQSML